VTSVFFRSFVFFVALFCVTVNLQIAMNTTSHLHARYSTPNRLTLLLLYCIMSRPERAEDPAKHGLVVAVHVIMTADCSRLISRPGKSLVIIIKIDRKPLLRSVPVMSYRM